VLAATAFLFFSYSLVCFFTMTHPFEEVIYVEETNNNFKWFYSILINELLKLYSCEERSFVAISFQTLPSRTLFA
jgi:hypothetical protein